LHDGGAIATYNLLKGLSEMGVSVDYVSLNTLKHFVDAETIEKEFGFLNKIVTHKIDTSIRIWDAFVNLFKSSSYNIDRFTHSEFAKIIQNLIDNKSYDVIHFEGLFVAQYKGMINSKVKTVLRQHNVEYKIWQTLTSTKSGVKKLYIQFLADRMEKFERQVLNRFDALVSITEADKVQIQNDLGFKGKIISIPAGIESKTNSKNPILSHCIYHIGSMEWMPNLEAMQWFHNEIWPILNQKNSKAEFFMAGKNMPAHLKQWDEQRFHVVGEVKNLEEFSADKSILAVPLRSGSGIRIKTIEAMMTGKAVVTTSQGALGLEIKDGEHCLIADDAKTFAEKIHSLIENDKFRQHIADNGKRYAESTFGNRAVSERWMRFYEELLSK
jgi:glycosyltransferase involved in cell wall biosynthesis